MFNVSLFNTTSSFRPQPQPRDIKNKCNSLYHYFSFNKINTQTNSHDELCANLNLCTT